MDLSLPIKAEDLKKVGHSCGRWIVTFLILKNQHAEERISSFRRAIHYIFGAVRCAE